MNKTITPRNDKSQPHGYWDVYWTGTPWHKHYYINGRRLGYAEWYSPNSGNIKKKEFNIK